MAAPRVVVLRALGRALLAGLTILTFVGGAALWGLWVQGRELRHLSGQTLETLRPLSEVREGLARFEVAVLRFRESLEPDLSPAYRALSDVQSGLVDLRGKEVGAELEPVAEVFSQLMSGLGRLRDAAAASGSGAILDKEFRELPEIVHRLDQDVARIAGAYLRHSVAEGESALSLAASVRLWVTVGLLVGWFLFLGSIVFSLHRIQGPFRDILGFVQAAADKDLTGGLPRSGSDELGALAAAASRLSETLVGTLSTLRRTAAEVASRGEILGARAREARDLGKAQLAGVDAGSRKAREVEAILTPLEELTAGLREGADSSAGSVQQILAMTQQVRAEMDGLCARVGSSTRSMEELTQASARVSALAVEVGGAAGTAAASATAIDEAAGVLREAAAEGRSMAEAVVGKAEEGRESMSQALQGMERIRQAVGAAVGSFDRLERELLRVGRVTQVIDDIAGRTNLLSLNAAIIAAQAGERGKAFGVVAGEIRNLAEKTAASTREIRSIVDGVVSGGRDAAEAVSEGAMRVVEGAGQTQRTGELLAEIHEGATRAARRLRDMEQAASGQTGQVGRVAAEIRQVTRGVREIVAAVREQEAKAQAVYGDLGEIELVAQQTLGASDEQTRGTELITRAVVDVSHASEDVDKAMSQVASLLRGLREDLEALGARAREDLALVSRLEVEGQSLAVLSGEIHREVEAFRIPAEPPAPGPAPSTASRPAGSPEPPRVKDGGSGLPRPPLPLSGKPLG